MVIQAPKNAFLDLRFFFQIIKKSKHLVCKSNGNFLQLKCDFINFTVCVMSMKIQLMLILVRKACSCS